MHVHGEVQLTGSNARDVETISVGDAAAVSLAKKDLGYSKAVITTEIADVRYWVNGTAPTTSAGHLVKAGGGIELDSVDQIKNFNAIAVSGTVSVLQVSYF